MLGIVPWNYVVQVLLRFSLSLSLSLSLSPWDPFHQEVTYAIHCQPDFYLWFDKNCFSPSSSLTLAVSVLCLIFGVSALISTIWIEALISCCDCYLGLELLISICSLFARNLHDLFVWLLYFRFLVKWTLDGRLLRCRITCTDLQASLFTTCF